MRQVFEVVLDHNDPRHHEQLNRATRELLAWAQEIRCLKLIREEQEIRPGVFRLRFVPNRAIAAPRLAADNLTLSRRRA